MTMETDLASVISGLCPRVFPDVADFGTGRPYVTYQLIGGRAQRYTENTAAALRNTFVQVNVWDDTRTGCLALIRQIEDALCASSLFTATPQGEPIADADSDLGRYGALQDFSIWAARS
jgi:hypothetical protein